MSMLLDDTSVLEEEEDLMFAEEESDVAAAAAALDFFCWSSCTLRMTSSRLLVNCDLYSTSNSSFVGRLGESTNR